MLRFTSFDFTLFDLTESAWLMYLLDLTLQRATASDIGQAIAASSAIHDMLRYRCERLRN
jgi:hypothetical protein